MWRHVMNYRYAIINDALCLFGSYLGEPPFAFFPLGISKDNFYDCIMEIHHRCGACVFRPLTREMADEFLRIIPEAVLTLRRDLFDYVYSTEQLINLSGKHFHSKRNHINAFNALYNYKYIPITTHNLSLLSEAADTLFTERDDEELSDEYGSICSAIDAFDELGLKAGVITTGGEIIAYSIGEKMNRDTALIHFEKANRIYNGIYSVINNDFLRTEFSDTIYVNREEDMGYEGLRKAKLSYNPVHLNEVYSISI
jgi:uncharacterized protein